MKDKYSEEKLKERFGDKSYSITKDYNCALLIKILTPARVSSLIFRNTGISNVFIQNYIWILYDKKNNKEYLYFNQLSKEMLNKLNEIRGAN